MEKFLLLVAIVLLTASISAGCGGVKAYSDSTQTISVETGKEFVIGLGSNPTTGYSWQVSHDVAMVEMEESWYELGKEAKEGAVGAGGVEFFKFKALKTGRTQITLDYQRPWEKVSIDQKAFTVDIK